MTIAGATATGPPRAGARVGHRAARATYRVVVVAAARKFVVHSASHRRQILDLAISFCRVDR